MFNRSSIRINGAEFSYQRAGTGRTLLYLHGAGGSGNAMPLMQALAEQFDVIVPDHPGFGQSDSPAWLDNIHDTAYYYLDFMASLNIQNTVLLGSSLGGWIAMEIAVRDQSRIGQLVLSNAAGLSLADVPMGDVFLWDDEAKIRNMICSRELQDKILSTPPSEEQREVSTRNLFSTARLCWEPRFCDPDLEKWLHRITVPTLIVWGEQDQLFPEAYGRNLHERIPHSEYAAYSDCGHLPHVEAMTRLHADVLQFSQRVA